MLPLAIAGAALGTPYLLKHGFVPIAFALQHSFALVCHQRPERSFWIFGAPGRGLRAMSGDLSGSGDRVAVAGRSRRIAFGY